MYLYSINYENIFILSRHMKGVLDTCNFFINQFVIIKNVIKISVSNFAYYFKSKTYEALIVLSWNYWKYI